MPDSVGTRSRSQDHISRFTVIRFLDTNGFSWRVPDLPERNSGRRHWLSPVVN
jgi:hypothetical protein